MSKVLINESTLFAIGDAIREKTNSTDTYKPREMPEAILSIQGGGGSGDGPTAEELRVTDGRYWNYYGSWDWFVRKYGNSITTEISSAIDMFYYSELESIPFDINFSGTSNNISSMFAYSKIKVMPVLKNVKPSNMASTFLNCYYLREIPEGYAANNNWIFDSSSWNSNSTGVFNGCYSLRCIDSGLLKGFSANLADNSSPSSASTSVLSSGFTNCYALNEIINVPVAGNYTSSLFSSTFSYCSRLKNVLFSTNEDGTPIITKWAKQTVALNTYVGYAQTSNNILNYNSGLTTGTQITDDITYQALKNNPDSWTTDINYSRYNHDSAVATINSLPDCSAYIKTFSSSSSYINTIKFKGASGALTDGGAVNTLTEEEIAVATAKGWTVSYT